ncbi:hypothetical protein B0H10DRAFT_2229663 [Mycena sp. CBHHK59/15]|nr:hypothetical protein B0H10DRAFT_2229663 [Mycena sp. CBHHK59/15]
MCGGKDASGVSNAVGRKSTTGNELAARNSFACVSVRPLSYVLHPIPAPSILHPPPSALHPPSRACALCAFAYPRPTPDLDGRGQRLQRMGAVTEVLGRGPLLVRAIRGNRRSGGWARMAEEGDVGKDIGSRRSIRRKGWDSDSAARARQRGNSMCYSRPRGAEDLAQRRRSDHDDEGGDFMPKEQGRDTYASPRGPAVGEHRMDLDAGTPDASAPASHGHAAHDTHSEGVFGLVVTGAFSWTQ